MGKGLLGPNDGSYGGKGRRGGSMVGRGDGGVEKISSTRSKLIAIGEDCLDGCDGAGRGEVNGGGVVLGVFKSLLSEIPGEVMGERGGETMGLNSGVVW
ncbi:hypothetical protein Tco_0119656 [Tanacetum coccineum]